MGQTNCLYEKLDICIMYMAELNLLVTTLTTAMHSLLVMFAGSTFVAQRTKLVLISCAEGAAAYQPATSAF